MAYEAGFVNDGIPDFVKEAEEMMARGEMITPPAAEEITIKFGKGLVSEPFTSKAGKELVEVMLEAAEYEIKKGKNISVRGNGQKRFIRLSSLPEEYREARLREVLEGTVEHTPSFIPKAEKRLHRPELLLLSLLVPRSEHWFMPEIRKRLLS